MGGPAYLAHDAARLVGVSGDRIGQWARWGHIRASISTGDPHVYSFDDVADAVAVHELLRRGASLEAIRTGQEVLPLDGEFDAVRLLRAGGWVARELGIDCIEVDPGRCLGRPCVRGRRVTVEDVVLTGGDGLRLDDGVVEACRRWWEAAP